MSIKEIKKTIIDQLLVEHSRVNNEIVVEYIGRDKDRMKALVEIVLGDDLKLHQRANYALNLIGEKRPEMVHPHLKKLLKLLPSPPHNSFARAIMRIYAMHPVPKKWQGHIADICFTYLEDPKTEVAVKCFSMTALLEIGRIENDLLPELELIINEYYEHGTAGYKSRAKRTLKEIQRILKEQ